MRISFSSTLVALLALTLSACGSGEKNVVSGNATGYLHYGNGAEPQGIDPHLVTGVPEATLYGHCLRASPLRTPSRWNPNRESQSAGKFHQTAPSIRFLSTRKQNGAMVSQLLPPTTFGLGSAHCTLKPDRSTLICCFPWLTPKNLHRGKLTTSQRLASKVLMPRHYASA